MKRLAVIVALVGIVPIPQAEASILPTRQAIGDVLSKAFALDIIPHIVAEHMVRWKLDMRDMLRDATQRLATIAMTTGFHAPDLTILSTYPLPAADTSWQTSSFGWRDDPMRHRRKFHSGADVRAKSGTPVFCAGDGVVVFSGRQGGYGNIVMVDHGGGVITRYAHLRRIIAQKGQALAAGEELGLVGSTGRATGPHLHFEVRLDGSPVNPGTALAVADLQRESPQVGAIAALALSPEMQGNSVSDLDPPKSRRKQAASTPKTSRPERTGRTKRVRPVS